MTRAIECSMGGSVVKGKVEGPREARGRLANFRTVRLYIGAKVVVKEF